ncbi:MAG TPA: DinB family protein [Dehalococcoidia bacterium]|nr:DinB family protein [Dehalococcoidia bacterium]
MTKQLRPAEAVDVLKRGHDDVAQLVASLAETAALRPGLGGGEWSVRDLLGHLTSWEEYALSALDAWSAGMTAPIDRALRRDGLDDVNLAAVRAKADQPYEQIRSDFEAVSRRLRERIGSISDTAWDAPPTPRFRRSLGVRLGSMLVGVSGAFGHADSHLGDLRAHLANETDAASDQAGREPRLRKKRSR